MNITFTNGTARQQGLWIEAINSMLNLPSDAMPLTMTVEFVASLEGANATSFAETLWEYGSTSGTIKVRNDAPGFGDLDAGLIGEAAGMGLTYDARLHFHETAIHETGHAVFASLSEARRLEIVALFGLTTDNPAVLQPSGKPWQRRIGESIAETFKEAFLPQRNRVFPNRTDHRLSYSKYPEFRRIVREGIEEMGHEGDKLLHARFMLGSTFCYEYLDFTLYPDDSPHAGEWPAKHRGDRDDEAFVLFPISPDFTDRWGIDMSQFPESSVLPYAILEEGIITT